jgi:hypothetical protein
MADIELTPEVAARMKLALWGDETENYDSATPLNNLRAEIHTLRDALTAANQENEILREQLDMARRGLEITVTA